MGGLPSINTLMKRSLFITL